MANQVVLELQFSNHILIFLGFDDISGGQVNSRVTFESAPMDDGIIVLHYNNALVGVEFEPVSDEDHRRIRAFIEMGVRRNHLEQRALQRRLNRKQFGKTILMGISIGES